MKVLRLTTSEDVRADVPEQERIYGMAAARFHALTGEAAEFTVRVIWPSPELPEIIDNWVGRYEPDVVQFCVNGYWYIYRSVPLQIERKLGRLGKPLASLGFKAGDINWFTRTKPYHWTREALLRTVGGATYFTVDEVVQVTEASLRRIARHEDVSIVLKGQLAPWASDPVRDYQAYVKMRDLAERLHVPYLANDPRGVDVRQALDEEDSDRLHFLPAARMRQVEPEADMLVNVWRERNHLPAT